MNTSGYCIKRLALLFLLSGIFLVNHSCKKARFFSFQDSIPQVPSRFRFFNSFSYDTLLTLNVDGVERERVRLGSFSSYFPFSSKINFATVDPSSKEISVSDFLLNTQFTDSLQVQFVPNTSYLVFPLFTAYDDSKGKPKNKTKPSLVYVREEPYSPYVGKTKLRIINGTSAGSISMRLSPDNGSGTVRVLQATTLGQTVNNSENFSRVSPFIFSTPGEKNITISTQGFDFVFNPSFCDDQKAYSFIAVGDPTNYNIGLEDPVRLFQYEEANAQSLKELKLKAVVFTSNQNLAKIQVISAAYNLQNVFRLRPASTDVGGAAIKVISFNNIRTGGRGPSKRSDTLGSGPSYWPLVLPGLLSGSSAKGFYKEEVGHTNGVDPDGNEAYENIFCSSSPVKFIQPMATKVKVFTPGESILSGTSMGELDYPFERGKAYVLLMKPLPLPEGRLRTELEVIETDLTPSDDYFKLRLINLMVGTNRVDLHTIDATGADKVILRNIGFGAGNLNYVLLSPAQLEQSLYISASGLFTNLFQNEKEEVFRLPFKIAFKPGNSGSIYLEGTLDPDDIYFPLVIYRGENVTNRFRNSGLLADKCLLPESR